MAGPMAGWDAWRTARRVLSTTAIVAVALTMLAVPAAAQVGPPETQPPTLELFWAEGCPYCEAERAWLQDVRVRYPQLQVLEYEVSSDESIRDLLLQRAAEHGFQVTGVPVTVLGDRHWIGFSDRIAADITAAIDASVAVVPEAAPEPDPATIDVPVVGAVDLAGSSLLVATVAIGAVDGLNPCSLWVLSVLLALVLHTRSRRRVLAVGSTFLVVTAALYALYVAGLYGVLSYIAFVPLIRVGLAVVAAAFGIIAIKDFFAFGRGISLSIPDSRKRGLYRRIRHVADVDRPLLPVLGGTVVMAAGVSLVETPCTAGFPLVWSNLLASHGVGGAEAVGLFGVYMLVFLADELLVFGAAVVTMRAFKVQERHGRLLKLVAGVVLLTLAVVMVAAPGLLEDVTGTLLVFGAAAVLTVLVAVVFRSRLEPSEVETSDRDRPTLSGRRR
jgi:cytochrome c biogenesis protein CcdA/glutaredoxin